MSALKDTIKGLFSAENYMESHEVSEFEMQFLRALRAAYEAGWMDGVAYERSKPDPIGEALNTGDGSYRP